MADDTCACRQSQIRCAPFELGQPSPKTLEKGLMALATVVGFAMSDANGALAQRAVECLVGTQNAVRLKAQRAAAGELSSMEVAGHGCQSAFSFGRRSPR